MAGPYKMSSEIVKKSPPRSPKNELTKMHLLFFPVLSSGVLTFLI